MKRILTLLFCGLTVLGAAAGNRSAAKMQDIAAQKLATLGTSGAKTRSVGVARVLNQTDLSVYTDGEHFAVISKDDRFPAVLAYGVGDFKADELNPSVQWWLKATERGLAEGKRTARSFQRAATYQPVAEILTTKWNQWSPYNNYAPALKLYDGQKAPAGCVAIAMAQVMNHHQYPASAQFEGFYKQEGVSDEAYQGNVNTIYSWPYKDYYNYYYEEGSNEAIKVSGSLREGNLVATLCRDCAYAVDMTYTHDGSGAQSYNLAQNMIDHFAYSKVGCHLYDRAYYTSDEWHALVYNELMMGYPLIYSGYDPAPNGGGHAFIADGIDAEGLVHVNWGWAGHYNGFFDMDLMNYDENEQYSDGQDVVVVRPEAIEGEGFGSLIGTYGPFTLTYDKDKKEMSFTWESFYNQCGKDIEGKVGFVFEHLTQPENSDILAFIDPEFEDEDFRALPAGFGFSSASESIDIENGELAPGDYHVYLASKDKHEGTYQMARLKGGAFYYVELSVDEQGAITVGESVTTSEDTAIHGVTVSDADRQQKGIYNLQGHNLGTNPKSLRKGIYIIDGKKVAK